MRIMIDTNILISAFVVKSPHIFNLMEVIAKHHTIVLSTYVINELKRVTKTKFPDRYALLETFLRKLPFELVYTPEKMDTSRYPSVRDVKDLPVLVSAINEDVDILVSGDSDFAPLDMEYPEIMTPREFIEKYG